MDDPSGAWRDVADALLEHALGETSEFEARLRIVRAAARGGIDPARLERVTRHLDGTTRPEAAVLEHRTNNALAGLCANVDYLSVVLGDASPRAPLLIDATPEDRADVLLALRHAVEASRKLSALLRGPFRPSADGSDA